MIQKDVKETNSRIKKENIRNLWYDSLLRKNLVFATILWVVNIFDYYLVIFYFKHFPGNIFTNTVAFALADIFSYVTSGVLLKKTSMKVTLILGYTIKVLSGFCFLILYDLSYLIPFIIIASRIGMGMVGSTTFVTNNRLFPT